MDEEQTAGSESADSLITAERLFDGHEVRRIAPGERVIGTAGGFGVAVRSGALVAVGTTTNLRARFPAADHEHHPNATIAPGLIDAHVHLTMPADGTAYEPAANRSANVRFRTAFINLRSHLEAGVTTVRDVGSHLDFLSWQPADALLVPRLLRYGPPITAPDGHMHLFDGASATAAEAKENANRNLAAGADGIKMVASGGGTLGTVPHHATLDMDIMAAAAAVAHDAGKLATTHALSQESMRRAIEARTNGIEHLGFLTSDNRSEFDGALAELAIERQVTFGSTLGCNNRYTARAVAGELDPREAEAQAERTAYYIRNAAHMRRLGGRIVAASDAGWKYTHFGDFANELRLLTLAEYSPLEALRLATGKSAEYLGLDDLIGRLAPGLVADITVFAGDPTTDITAATGVRAVYRGGVRVHSRYVCTRAVKSGEEEQMVYTYTPPSRIRRLDVPQRTAVAGHSVRGGEKRLEEVQKPPGTLDLTSADTNHFRPPTHALDAFVRAVSDGVDAYTPYRGDAGARRAVATNVSTFLGIDVDPASQLILTPGTQAALYTALACLVDEGDEVVLVDPDCLNNERNIRYLGGVPRFVPLRWETDDHAPELDLDALEQALAHGARIVQLSHPNNPTGAVFTATHVRRIAEMCCAADAFVIADELYARLLYARLLYARLLYARLLYDGQELNHLAALPGMAERTLTTLGPSKTESGYRVGVAVAPPELIDRMEDVLSVSAIRCPTYAQHVLPHWLVDDKELVAAHVATLQRNREHAHEVLNQLDGVRVRRSLGTSYMFPDVSGLGASDNEVAAALRRAGLVVNPGYQFGFAGVGHFRICLAQQPGAWVTAIATMADVLSGLTTMAKA